MRHLLAVAFAAGLGACGIFGPGDDPEEALSEARARWTFSDYVYRLERDCFCPSEALGPAWVTVSNTVEVTSVVYVDTGEPVPEPYASSFVSVEALFDLIEEALETGADRVEVTYDPNTGLPTDVFIDYSAHVADEEIGFRAAIAIVE